jgi:hypothetical protein
MQELIEQYRSLVQHQHVREYDTPGDRHTVRLELIFSDQSRLIVYESRFYDTGRFKYSYQWMTKTNELIHRWDNAHEVPLPTSSHHQHIGSEDNVQPSEPMTLTDVLTVIAQQITSG